MRTWNTYIWYNGKHSKTLSGNTMTIALSKSKYMHRAFWHMLMCNYSYMCWCTVWTLNSRGSLKNGQLTILLWCFAMGALLFCWYSTIGAMAHCDKLYSILYSWSYYSTIGAIAHCDKLYSILYSWSCYSTIGAMAQYELIKYSWSWYSTVQTVNMRWELI